jgi:uncharacterized BrkB/YihY/UPF0761 family membrane protein
MVGGDGSARSVPGDADSAAAVIDRLPPRLRGSVEWASSRWPGRIVVRSLASCIRIELFDRSMTIAWQFFTSVFPILVTIAVWAGPEDSNEIAEALNMPEESRSVLNDALDDSSSATFGTAGVLIVLISATSLSRALTRAFADIWMLPRPRSSLASAWRWLAVVLCLALSLIAIRALGAYLDASQASTVALAGTSLGCDLAVALFVPWILLSGTVAPRSLVPGALLFAIVMLVARPASATWLPRTLEASAERYGSIGVAFTYLAWLYALSFCFLATTTIGQVVESDRGTFGRWLRGVDEYGVART